MGEGGCDLCQGQSWRGGRTRGFYAQNSVQVSQHHPELVASAGLRSGSSSGHSGAPGETCGDAAAGRG